MFRSISPLVCEWYAHLEFYLQNLIVTCLQHGELCVEFSNIAHVSRCISVEAIL